MSIQNWEHFFKPEVRSNGRALFAQGKVSIAQPSDTEMVVYIRTSPPLRVSLKTQSLSSNTLFADCSCPAGKKNLFCKHIWAGLLAAEEKNPDFFESKIEIEKKESSSKTTEKAKPAQSQAWTEKKAAFKEKQNIYRKEQYQKQKQRLKDLKKNTKNTPQELRFPREVEKALSFFSQNGFELRETLSKELVSIAKKKLARVFHPDIGGSHEEILELTKNADILTGFLKKSE